MGNDASVAAALAVLDAQASTVPSQQQVAATEGRRHAALRDLTASVQSSQGGLPVAESEAKILAELADGDKPKLKVKATREKKGALSPASNLRAAVFGDGDDDADGDK